MKHLATIQTEFLKEARKWDDRTLDEQRAYLKRHPKSKRRITARPVKKNFADKERLFAKAKRFSVLQDGPEPKSYEQFYEDLKAAYPNKKKLIDKLRFVLEDANSVNYLAKYDPDNKDKTGEDKLKTKKLLNELHGKMKKIINSL